MLNEEKQKMLSYVRLYEYDVFANLVPVCEQLCRSIRDQNSKCAEELEEILNNQFDEDRFRKFVAVYTAKLHDKFLFKKTCELFYEYQKTKKAEILLKQ